MCTISNVVIYDKQSIYNISRLVNIQFNIRCDVYNSQYISR